MNRIIITNIILLLLTCLPIYAQEKPVLSEIMFKPSASNSEFIEIYNPSNNPIDLTGYSIGYYTSNADAIISLNGDMILDSQSFAVIFEGDYDIENGIYIIPESTLILYTDDNAFGRSGMANSSDRPVYLLDPQQDTVAALIYSADNDYGISDEKIELNDDDSAENWENSSIINGTPGAINSVSPKKFDLAVSSINVNPEQPVEGDNILLTVTIHNHGTSDAGSFALNTYLDEDLNDTAGVNELIDTQSLPGLQSESSLKLTIALDTLPLGSYKFISEIVYEDDQAVNNNSMSIEFDVLEKPADFNDIVINEIMYDPKSGEPEWIELYNRSDEDILIMLWSIADLTSQTIITFDSVSLNSKRYMILAKDSTITKFYEITSEVYVINLPTLNNGGDELVLEDNLGRVIDTVNYNPAWGGNSGVSLERISADSKSNDENNWGSSINPNYATPGEINSITQKDYDLRVNSITYAPLQPVANNIINIIIEIENIGINDAEIFSVDLFLDENRDSTHQPNELINTFNLPFLESGQIRELEFQLAETPPGNYNLIGVINYDDDQDRYNNITLAALKVADEPLPFNSIIVNEIMYDPIDDEPEWIELYNNTEQRINIKKWHLADANSQVQLTEEDLFIEAFDYFVVAQDSSIEYYYDINSPVLFTSFPALNNTGDRVLITDSLMFAMDSLTYTPAWGGRGKHSLERLSYTGASDDSANWGTSISKYRATPGEENSIVPKDYDLSFHSFKSLEENIFNNISANFEVEIVNKGLQPVQSFSVDIILDQNENRFFETNEKMLSLDNLILLPGDTLKENFTGTFAGVDTIRMLGIINFASDENNENDSLLIIKPLIQTDIKRHDIVINEFMYAPNSPYPEWIEFYNRSSSPLNIKSFSAADDRDTTTIIDKDFVLNPNSFIVVCKDSIIFDLYDISSPVIITTFPSLNNSGDRLMLLDNYSRIIDSLTYHSDWGGTGGQSLERLNIDSSSYLQTNWATSIDTATGTPGRENSVVPKEFDIAVKEIDLVPDFPGLNEEVALSVTVQNLGKQNAENISLSININEIGFSENSLITNIAAGDSVIHVAEKTFNMPEKIEIFVEALFQLDQDSTNNILAKTFWSGFARSTFLINEVMYAPASGDPEWIEIVNVSEQQVNINGWMIAEGSTLDKPVVITNHDYIIAPGEFVIIADDTSEQKFPAYTQLFEINLGELNSSEEDVVLFDFRGAVIDSLHYNSSWGGGNGYSLERISLAGITNDRFNWTSSLGISGSSPGISNYALNVKQIEESTIAINEIMFDPADGNSEFIEFINNSDQFVEIGNCSVEDNAGNKNSLSSSSFTIAPNSLFVAAADSSILLNYSYLKNFNQLLVINSDLSLNNRDDLILFTDAFGNTVDSLYYSSEWHNRKITTSKNKSLERINPYLETNDPSNWSTSVDKDYATPGEENSIFTENELTESKISISPNPFSPDNDAFEDYAIINYNLDESTAQIRLQVFDSKGRKVRTLVNNQLTSSQGSIIFDGLDEDGNPLKIGIYILLIEAINASSGTIETLKDVVVIARKL